MTELLDQFEHAVVAGDADKSAGIARAIAEGALATPDEVFEHLGSAMEKVGSKYETGEYFVPEMLRSAEAVRLAIELLEPYLFTRGRDQSGVIVMGTVKGDIHNIGKNIIVLALRAAGYDVHDLGVNVSTMKFIKAVKETSCDILMLSAFTTSTKVALLDVLTALEREGLRDRVKVVSGGASHSEEFAAEVGVDAFARDVKSALAVCRELLQR
ncbi:MAG: cobalamin B12-binding domain-containing protein [Thermoleophilia bacterium]|nr:cobalamin B12-binding domain-containing protein [Thermoleophilia bacterium]